MNGKGRAISLVILFAIALGLVYTVWEIGLFSPAQSCDACHRPLHTLTKTIGIVDGRKEVFCCPTCALTAHRQTGQAVQITELTDYETDHRLNPPDAYIVEGSDLNLCTHHHVIMEMDKQATPLQFDRCSPSIMAFAKKESAEKFRHEHGGSLMLFRDLADTYRQ